LGFRVQGSGFRVQCRLFAHQRVQCARVRAATTTTKALHKQAANHARTCRCVRASAAVTVAYVFLQGLLTAGDLLLVALRVWGSGFDEVRI
jgi:hypothetical protein